MIWQKWIALFYYIASDLSYFYGVLRFIVIKLHLINYKLFVITSYSIHYTKLYDLNKISYFFEKENYYKTVAAWLNIDKKDFKENYPDFPENALSVYNRLVVNPINKDEIYLVLV